MAHDGVMPTPVRIVVGSMSQIKIEAVRVACIELNIVARIYFVDCPSRANKQPEGYEETFAGAARRSRAALAHNSGAEIHIGIESGLFSHYGIYVDVAVILVNDASRRNIVTTSRGVQIPENFVDIARERGFETTTVGSVVAETLGGDKADPHSTLTNGKENRLGLLTEAIVSALRQADLGA